MSWEVLHDSYGERVRRFKVSGGYLYQVELQNWTTTNAGYVTSGSTSETGWHPPVFVPTPSLPEPE